MIAKITGLASLVAVMFAFAANFAAASEIYHFRDSAGAGFYTNAPGLGRTKVCFPLPRGKRYRAQTFRFDTKIRPESYEALIAAAGRNYEVDPDVVKAVIAAESNYDKQAVSPKGALGLMQLMPSTARDLGVTDPFDPGQNIDGGVRYLSWLLTELKGDLSLALAAYNAGPTRVFGKNRIPAIPETQSYVARVLKLYNNFKGKNTL